MPLPRFSLPLLTLFVVAGALVLPQPHPTEAAAFVVTKTADTNDGECSAGDCSLREAIIAANAAPGADMITVPPDTYTLTLSGASEQNAASGDLDITDDVTIRGFDTRQTIVDGENPDSTPDVVDPGNVEPTDGTSLPPADIGDAFSDGIATALWIGISLAVAALVALIGWRVERALRRKA